MAKSIFDQAVGPDDAYEEALEAVSQIYKECPMLADLLTGDPGSKGGVFRGPGSVRLLTNGGVLKLELWGPTWEKRGYILVPKEFNSFGHFEKMLTSEKISWSTKRERKDSSKDAPY